MKNSFMWFLYAAIGIVLWTSFVLGLDFISDFEINLLDNNSDKIKAGRVIWLIISIIIVYLSGCLVHDKR